MQEGQMNDGVVIFYCKDGTLYPVALTSEQNDMLQFTARLLGPLKVVQNQPQGPAVNLLRKKEAAPDAVCWD